MAIINRSYITSLLRPGVHAIFGNYDVHNDLWKEYFTQHVSHQAVEYDIEMQGLGYAEMKPEGSPSTLGEIKEVFKSSYTHQVYSIGFQITQEAIDDNLYKSQFPMQMLNLRNSLSAVRNVNGTFLLNNAFNDKSAGADGKRLCAVDHPTANGSFANTFTNPVGLNEVSLEDAVTIIRSYTNYAGLRIDTSPKKLVVPTAQDFNASRILNSVYRPDSAVNAINPIVHDKVIPGGHICNPYILDPNSWFLFTNEINGFKFFSRKKAEVDFITDTLTNNVTVRIYERYAMGYANSRCVFGSAGN